ncbi:MAG: restriction endonuclease subunit S [Pirellula sp.]|jgi:type I restriction enzyme S subunit
MSIATNSLNGYGTIPDHWEATLLPEVVFFQEGPGLRKWQWTESGMKVINVTNILGDGSVDTNNTSRFISMAEYEKTYRHFTVDAGDIVVASSGNTYGKVGRVSAKDLPLMMNTSVIRFHSSDPKRLDDDFLYAFLRSEVFRNQVEAFVIGSAQPNFGPTHIKRMVMPLPPLPIQRRIAGILSAYDELIENSQRRIKILESMARALYREWFVHFRFPGHESVPRVPSPLGDIPKGWEVKTVEEIVKRIPVGKKYDQKTVSLTGEVPVFDQGKSGIIGYHDDEPGVVASETSPVIVFANHTCYQRLVHIPFSAIQNVLPFVSSPEIPRDNYWLHWATNGLVVFNDYKGHWPEFASKALIVPSEGVCQLFGDFAAPLSRHILKLEDQIVNLRRTRDLLLPRLLSGQIDVEAIAS